MTKIFGFEINNARKHAQNPIGGELSVQKDLQQTLPSVPLKKAYPRAELGDSGTRMLHGIITEEYLSNLQGIQGIKIYDEMRKSDGTVRAAILVITLPIRRAKWFINPSTDNPKDKEIANFVEHALFDWLNLSWEDVVRQALLMVPFGVMVFEKVYTIKDHDGKSYVTLEKLAPRLPKSILQWELKDQTFGIQQIRQDGVLVEIPGSKLVVFVNEREGNNWWGNSMLRSSYKHWYYKNGFYKIDALAFERQGLGIPVMKMPTAYTENDEAKAKTALQNLRANESSFLIIPDGYTFEFANMGGHTTRDATNSINHHNKEILQSVLAQFLELGSGGKNTGSRALSQDHSDLFLKALESIANNFISEINKNLIPELVDMNFNDVTLYPVLDYSGITKTDIASLGTAYSNLVRAGGITPTDDDQQYIRAALGLPPRTQDDLEAEEDDDPTMEQQADHVDIEDDSNDIDDPGTTNTQTKKDNNNVDNGTAKVKQKSNDGVRLKKKFTDEKGFESWRPLTFAENKVSFGNIQDTMNKLQDSFSVEAKALLNKSKDAFMTKLHTAIKNGDTKEIASLELKFVNDYKALIKKVASQAYEYGKSNVSSEMGIATPPSTATSIANIDLMAETIANKTTSDIVAKAKISTANALKKDTSVLQTVGIIDAALETIINKVVDNTASILIGQGINNGRNDVFARNRAMIYALQRSEVLDERTCDFCLSMDGLVIEPTDDWASTDVFHGNCRGIWVEILKDESNPPDVTGVPNNIGDYYGGEPNALVQPPKPILQPGSPAEAVVKERDAAKVAKKNK